ncbi:hypothetical protein CENSYa_1430 [Cenarchaeum symbiosum A]|uniref:Uncharacterized protein n=1 Tax=Cenarchaeum symbiosum (strain A) TaxID=414004 RepID=A0RXI5_CENSY|nr:hypothetical protein CENSYa_1430 [Cenarchaeum symbiosum A]
MASRHLQERGRDYRVFLYIFYTSAAMMCSIAVYGGYAMYVDWAEDGSYVMGEVLNTTVIPFENFARLSTWLFFSTIMSWYCVSRIGWKRTAGDKIPGVRMPLLQLMLLGFAIICLYEVLWNFTVLNAQIAAGIAGGAVPDIDTLTVAYPDVDRPWNLIFATKIFLSGFLISAHAFYLSTRPRKSPKD